MNKAILICLVLLNAAESLQTTESLPQYRTRNLVICNDITEFYTQGDFPLPWNVADNRSYSASSHDLLYALSANQLVLTTKSLWHNVQFFGEMWHDFATMTESNLISKYQTLSRSSDLKFNQHVQTYSSMIKKIHAMYELINATITSQRQQPLSYISHLINVALQKYNTSYEWQNNKIYENNLITLFTAYTLYRIMLANNYECKQISEVFILFIPTYLLSEQQVYVNVSHMLKTNGSSTNQDINLGLKYSSFTNYPYRNLLTEQQARQWKFPTTEKLGSYLIKAIQEMFLTKKDFKKQAQIYTTSLLPYINIFLKGHGTKDTIIAEISTTFTNTSIPKPTKNTSLNAAHTYKQESSDFMTLLNFFEKQINTKSLTISSCYPGGKKIKNSFNITSKFNAPLLESITYPIILIGTTLATTTTYLWYAILPPFKNLHLNNYIYRYQGLYGPYKPNDVEVFVTFFNYINRTKTYEKYTITNKQRQRITKFKTYDPNKKPASNSIKIEQPLPSYLHAANIFAQIYDPSTNKINTNNLANYILIKYPHTSWFTPARFHQLVKKLSQIATAAQDTIPITDQTQTILMDANIVEATLRITATKIPAFIPINYINQNYVFNKIELVSNKDINEFIKQFFTIQKIEEPIHVVIKQLIIGNKTYENVYIFISNNFGTQELKNGYTMLTNQCLITSWPYHQSVPNSPNYQPFNKQDLQKLITKVENNATKNIILPNKTTMQQFISNKPAPDIITRSRQQANATDTILSAFKLTLLL
ncbi:MAG: hypothetical protein CL947_03410 [Epsilonproteobacteria bacterium]|nr:hypothetical protein [Campylobacterota bacterium]MBM18085.1 hypothetical protein [Campylobacterota bacterium]|tara:strand:+ start:947 stop:3238 length:2292 start_codon:yes stop_codon:yes gene_type:complete